MEPSICTRSSLATLASVATLALGGCNALLDNRPADMNADLFATDPAGDSGPTHDAARDADASVPDPGPADPGADAGNDSLSPQCAVGTKPCGDVCVSLADPNHGCAGPTCDGCTAQHGAAACVAGQCALAKCAAGWADCNHVAGDGCEVDLSSATSCGACGVTCPAASAHAESACVGGACSMQCDANYGDCNDDLHDGCETSLMKDKRNCGGCGQLCLLGRCEAGACVLKP